MHAHEKPEPEKSARREQPPQQSSQNSLLALQRTAGNNAVTRMVQRATAHDVLGSSGSPLDEPVRTEMEARMGADFSSVRVHTDAAARRSAAELGARAYTSGEHVVIGDGGADRHTLAHELTHVIQQRNGPVAGTVQKDGLSVSDPGDNFERAAEANAHRVMSGAAPEVLAEPGGHHHSGTPPVQRMQLTDFNQHLATTAVANDPDFITYFEIRRGRLDPGAVVDHPQAGSQARLRRLVETDAVTTQLVDDYIQTYLTGGQGAAAPPMALNNPNVTGLEIELADVVLDVPRNVAANNGALLGETTPSQNHPATETGRAVMRLEIEGMDRMNPPNTPVTRPRRASVEIVYGPLSTADYQDPSLLSARRKLHTFLRRRTEPQRPTVRSLLTAYNNSLNGGETRYRLTLTPLPASLTKSVATSTGTNTQTNVSTPYAKLGTDTHDAGDFSGFFENEVEAPMFAKAREEAGRLAGEIDSNWITRHGDAGGLRVGDETKSFLTHILYQEAKYIAQRATMRRDRERPEDKQHFHVMLKLSPQDAIMSILSDDDAKLLLAWVIHRGDRDLATAAKTTYRVRNNAYQAGDPTPDTIRRYLVSALVARLVAGRQLLEVTGRQSRVFGGNREVAKVTHFHPRSSNRIAITVNNNRYYMVVEQRRAAHPLNQDGDPGAKVNRIGDLQSP